MTLKLWMVFEAVAPESDAVEDSLDQHMEKLRDEDEVEILESNIDEVEEVQDPHPDLEKGYSQVAECRVEVDNFAKCIRITFNYGPTYVQMEGPEEYTIDLKEGQDSLQEVADTMHNYAQMGAGGVIVSKPTEDQ